MAAGVQKSKSRSEKNLQTDSELIAKVDVATLNYGVFTLSDM